MTRAADDHELAAGAGQTEADDLRTVAQLHGRDAAGDHAHRAHALFIEADGVAVVSHSEPQFA